MHADDMDLVREFAAHGSEEAFATLVRRHVNLVYSAALRRLGNAAEAEEVAQIVFLILAKKAGSLRRGTILSGWLYQTAQLTAANHQRAAIRRQHREQEAFMQFSEQSEPDTSWHRLSPLLEEAMARLGQKERDAIVLRFFENRTVREVAAALGLREDAAQKRVNRATDKLRLYFVRRGVQVSTAALLASMGTHAVQAAPAELAAQIAATAVLKGAAGSGSTLTLIKTTLKIMAWTKAKTAIVVVAGVLLAAGTTTVTVKEIAHHREVAQANRHTGGFAAEAEIQPDGMVHARVTLEFINTGNETVTPKDRLVINNGMNIERFTDGDGQSIRFTQKAKNANQFEYSFFLNHSVPPGKKFAVTMEGTMDGIGAGLIKPTAEPGVFEVQCGDTMDMGGYAIHCTEVIRLPPGTVLLDKSPNLKETASNGRIQLRFDQVLPPPCKLEYRFRYQLADIVK